MVYDGYHKPSPADVHLGDFHLGAIMNNAVMTFTYKFLSGHVYGHFFWVVLQNEISDSE